MAASKIMMQERRLRPVYDALDNLNNKKAIKLADGILKKQKDLHCAKALKAIALIRSGKSVESTPLLEDIKETADKLDDATLQAMTMCYKENHCPDGIVSIYEIAVKQTPKNEEFLSHLFMACVRVKDYGKQQQAAMNLYKAFPKNPYYFWAVMSIVMQALSSRDDKKKNTFLSLAERMVAKFIKEEKIEAEEEVRMYMIILEFQEKYDELLKLLESDFGDKLRCVLLEKTDKTIEYMEKLERWVDLNIRYKSVFLKEIPNQWSYYQGYLRSFMKLYKDGYKPDVPIDTENLQPDCTVNDVRKFLTNMGNDHSLLRGPQLALLELEKLLLENGEGSLEELSNGIIKYFIQFGCKPCCFDDIKSYVGVIPGKEQPELIEKLRSNVKLCGKESGNKEKVSQLTQEICIECLCRQIGLHDLLTAEEKFEKAKSYMKKYKSTLSLGKELKPTELKHGDVLVLLAVYLLMDINRERGDGSMNWHILLFLEEELEMSPSNAQFKFLLYFTYSKLGAFGPCDQLIDSIEIKYIMYDTLGYFLTYAGYGSGQFQATRRVYNSTIGFFGGNHKDTPEQIISSYKYGSFRQVLEINNFMDRVNRSYQFSLTMLNKLFLDILQCCNSVDKIHEIFDGLSDALHNIDPNKMVIEELTDNRDIHVMDNFDPPSRQFDEEDKKKSFIQNVLWIRLRYWTLKGISLCFDHLKHEPEQTVNGNSKENYISLDVVLDSMEKTLTEINKYNYEEEWVYVHHPPPCHVGAYCRQKYDQINLQALKTFILLINSNDTEEEEFNNVRSNAIHIEAILKDNLSDILASLTTVQGENRIFNGGCLPKIVNFIETCTCCALLLVCTKELMKQKLANGRRAKKKKSQSINEETSKCLQLHCNFLCERMTELYDGLTAAKHDVIDRTLDDSVIEGLFEKTNSTTVAKIWQKIQSSYQQSASELIQTLELRIKFFESLYKPTN